MLSIVPLIPQRWLDFEQLFGPRGACGGCWCMYWKLRGKAFLENKGEIARQMQRTFVAAGKVPGLLAYLAEEPVGWIAVEPRSEYLRLAHSRILKQVDQDEVWSAPCFFVRRENPGRIPNRPAGGHACCVRLYGFGFSIPKSRLPGGGQAL